MSDRREDHSRGSEEELAALALQGSAAAWNELASRHTRRVVVTLLARGVPLELAEDLAQEVWLRLIEQQRAGRLSELRLPGLAIAQARWLEREASRTRRRHEAITGSRVAWEVLSGAPEAPTAGLDPEHLASDRERLEIVLRELARCAPRAREVFQAVYGSEARSHAQVARDFGLSVQRVRQILCEVRARLRRALESEEGGSEPWNT